MPLLRHPAKSIIVICIGGLFSGRILQRGEEQRAHEGENRTEMIRSCLQKCDVRSLMKSFD